MDSHYPLLQISISNYHYYIIENVTDAIDKGKPFDCIYLDFAKAFDKVPHFRLIKNERHME